MTTDTTPDINGTHPLDGLAERLYLRSLGGASGRPWKHLNASTRHEWIDRATEHFAKLRDMQPAVKPPGMRTYVLVSLKLDLSMGNVLEVELPDGWRVVHHLVTFEKPRIAMPGGSNTGETMPVLILEVDPNAPKRRCRFVVLSLGASIETADVLTPIAGFTNPQNGQVIVVYVAPCPPAEAVPDDSDRPAAVSGELAEREVKPEDEVLTVLGGEEPRTHCRACGDALVEGKCPNATPEAIERNPDACITEDPQS